ncbi:hypothetical protein VSH64_23780 [Amycolatopsis rhabdoformis]|uniref:Uncharacterized protein n=1 Tax=Amycolatopsis rhabdoformis TaxID=1448059 RepID=A0ABZ1HWD4_9PSEU|nr:hypothetical protein [Amycolatopsis rhabdoformis]WSE25911.1 hypothetical protein VSH64_23780 [Amycolatopsis rhabdoformis]
MTDPDGDPTADFLADVRAEQTPWRTDRPVEAEGPEGVGQQIARGRFSRAARIAGEAAPYVQAALFAAWIATSIADSGDGSGGMNGGQSG